MIKSLLWCTYHLVQLTKNRFRWCLTEITTVTENATIVSAYNHGDFVKLVCMVPMHIQLGLHIFAKH